MSAGAVGEAVRASATPSRQGRVRPELAVTGAAFFLSGAAALVYQVAWQRILALHTGVGIYSVATIVAAFMVGLGAGSRIGGDLSGRLGARASLRAFALVEVGIGLFGAASAGLYYDVLYVRAGGLYASPLLGALLHLASLFPATCLMGMSLPLLVRAMVRDASGAGATVGLLYAINVLGASCGALLTPWLLVRFWGVRGALAAAAAANVVVGLAALASGRLLRVEDDAAPGAAAATPAPGPPGGAPGLWLSLYAASGFCALSLEIVWFRVLDVAVRSSAFTFGTVLALYLLGLGLGSLLARGRASRTRRPLQAFLTCQCLILLYSALAIAAIAWLPARTPVLEWFLRFWQQSGPVILPGNRDFGALLRLYLLLPAVLFGPPTVLMGISFPVLQQAVQDDPRTSGRKVGLLQAANIAGCVAGSLLVGLATLTWLGTAGTLRVLLAAGLGFAAVGARRYGMRSRFGAFALLLAVAAAALPGRTRLWLRLHGTDAANPDVLVDEDASSVGAMLKRRGNWLVFVNGKSHSWIPYGGVHTRLGATPAILHPAPADVAIVGLGSGNTAWAAACRPETRSLEVFEISGPQPRLLRRLLAREAIPAVKQLLNDPRLSIVVADGRAALGLGDRSYDLIEADALWPEASYAGTLYSEEFFALCARKLKAGGLLCTWAPTRRVLASFSRVMPYVLRNGDATILIGSRQPLAIDWAAWARRLASPEVQSYLGADGVARARETIATLRDASGRGRRFSRAQANQDLFPRDEFATPWPES